MEIAVKMAEMSSEGRGRRRCRRRGGLPRRRHHGGASPLSPLPSWLHGCPPPWRWNPWGRQKPGSGGCKFVGGGVLHELGFLPLYSLLDSRLPILGRTRMGLTRPSGVGIRWILCPKRLPWNSLQLCSWRVFRLTLSSTRNVTIFEKIYGIDFWKSQFDSNKVFICILGNSYTLKCKTRTLCTFATISRLVQINHKSATKCRQNIYQLV
jgi:hypothetical protein